MGFQVPGLTLAEAASAELTPVLVQCGAGMAFPPGVAVASAADCACAAGLTLESDQLP